VEAQSTSSQQELFGHPKGLFYLFFAELWERFSFYGMRALLMLYMVKELFVAFEERDTIAVGIYASYGTLVYATPALGGMLADKLLGFRRAIMLGGVFMSLGHFVLAFEHPMFFYAGLALIIIGNGLFKPNISSFVGTLYEPGDTRRDSGFTIFYMGINLGAFVAPLLCGWLGENYGWHYGFGVAGFGMLLGLLVFWRGMNANVFGEHGHPPEPALLEEKKFGLKTKHLVPILAVLFIPVIAYLLQFGDFAIGNMFEGTIVSFIFNIIVIGIISYLIWMMFQVSLQERKKLIVIIFLSFLMTIFWAFYELSGSLITLFADRNINLIWITPSGTNALTAMFVISMALPFSALWIYLSKRVKNPRTPYKFAFGLASIGIGFLLLSVSGQFADEAGRVPFVFLLGGYFMFVVGELNMSPVGLSKITELSPKKLVGFMMGIWFLASAYAFNLGGFIGRKMAIGGKADGADVSGYDSLSIYTSGFENIAYIGFGAALFALVLAPLMTKWMSDVH
jgi:POT family proton-dependent oligopeptide transporter